MGPLLHFVERLQWPHNRILWERLQQKPTLGITNPTTMHLFRRVVCAALLVTGPTGTVSAQEYERVSRFAIGMAPQWRAIGAPRERHIGFLGEMLVWIPRTTVSPRVVLGIAHFGSPFKYEGRLCNPDGPCDYYAPKLTVASEAVGAEWQIGARGPRAVLALGGYQVLSRPVQGPSLNDPGARRGARTAAGIHAGLLAPWSKRVEAELRFEWLTQSIESTRYFLPVVVRFKW